MVMCDAVCGAMQCVMCGLTSQVPLLIQHDILRFKVTVNYAV